MTMVIIRVRCTQVAIAWNLDHSRSIKQLYTCIIISILRTPQICILYVRVHKTYLLVHKTVGRCTRKRIAAGLMKLYYYYHYYYGHRVEWLNACIYYNTIYLPIIFVPRHTFRLILNGDLMRSMTSVPLYNVRRTLYSILQQITRYHHDLL